MKTRVRLAVPLLFFVFCALSFSLLASPLYAENFEVPADRDGHNCAVRMPKGASAEMRAGSFSAFSASPTLSATATTPRGASRRSQFLPPRHELAGSAIFERRGRLGGVLGLPRAQQNLCSDADRRTLKEAERASRSALLFAMRSYDRRFVNDITEGGKNVVREVSNIKDWADAIPSVTTD